jgi:ABC-type multidrug transport system fused ATPase/permease subunit
MLQYIRLLIRYLRPHSGKVALLGVCLLSLVGLQLGIPQVIRAFIDIASTGGTMHVLVRLALLYLGLSILLQALSASSAYLSADVGWRATNLLRSDLFSHALSLDMAYHKEHLPGEMVERIDGDVTNLSNFFSQFVARVVTALLLVIGVLVLLWRENWLVGLSLTVFTGIALMVLHWRRDVAVRPMQQAREASGQIFGFIEERLSGLDDIRANGAGRYVMHRFLQLQRQWFSISDRAWWLNSTVLLSTGILFAVGHILTLSLGIWLWQSGVVMVGTVYLFYSYMSMLENPLDQFTRQMQEFQRAAAGLARVRELLDARATMFSGPRSLAAQAHSVEFEQVRFAYSAREVIQGVSFRLEPGEKLGLLGRTGSGKTTLIRLACRLYDPTHGRIQVDGIDLRQLNISDIRRRMALVTQDVQLFGGTVRDNLTFFNSQISDDKILRVLHELGLGAWVEELPGKLDGMLDAGGAGLSAGQSQLLALARAFLRDPGVVILDEPSSRLDPATERLMTDAIDRLLQGRSAIIIAHRLATVQRADKIMVMSDGKILEYGPREALARVPDSRYNMLLRLSSEFASLDEQLEYIA